VDARFVALDLLAQAEHGAASLAIAVSAERALIDAVEEEIERLAGERPTTTEAALVLLDAPSLEEGFAFAESFAPEHLQLMGAGAEDLAPRVRRAGCVFVGTGAGTAFGDYVAGSNHVLPTGGAARFASGLHPGHFRRRMTEVRIPPGARAALAQAGAAIARIEGFAVHAESMEARVRENESQ
jgi:histidinol dehydrogenase